MPRDDRERNFETALARNLQPRAPANNCPDTEILAAYHERLLAPEEMISRKQHVAACSHCQEILAQLEATDKIPLQADHQELVSQKAIAVPRMQLVHAARASASPAAQEAVLQAASSPKISVRSANWRWLAPAGALAAILLVWVAVHERTPQEFKLAKNQPALAPEVSPAAPTPALQPLAKEESAREDLPAQTKGKTAIPEKTGAMTNERDALEKKARPPSLPKPTAPRGAPQPSDSIVAKEAAQTQSRVLAQSPDEDKQRAARDATPPLSSETAPSITASAANSVTPAPSARELSRAKRAETAASTAAVPAYDQTTRAGTLAVPETLNSRLVRNPFLVSSPDRTVTWRLASSGIVERSDDEGRSWTLQKTAIVADLLAGSAPTNNVCWIVGRTGAILRTTDGGQHWRQTFSPTTEDIASVFAVDAQQSTITTARNKSYRTTDSGITWIPILNP
jgi:Photosynthesis system II assembly factor YCF48